MAESIFRTPRPPVGVDSGFQTPQPAALAPQIKGWSGKDTCWFPQTDGPFARQSDAGGPYVCLGQIQGISVWVSIPKNIFEYYPPWLKEQMNSLDKKRWDELYQINKSEIDSNSALKALFDLVKDVAAGSLANAGFMIAPGHAVIDLINSEKITPTEGGSPVKQRAKPEAESPIQKQIAQNIVKGLFLPVTILQGVIHYIGRGVDLLGQGLEAAWKASQPVVGPIINALTTVFGWIRRGLAPLFSFLQEHTRPTRAREDLSIGLKWVGRKMDRLAEVLGLKTVARALGNALVRLSEAVADRFFQLVDWFSGRR